MSLVEDSFPVDYKLLQSTREVFPVDDVDDSDDGDGDDGDGDVDDSDDGEMFCDE